MSKSQSNRKDLDDLLSAIDKQLLLNLLDALIIEQDIQITEKIKK